MASRQDNPKHVVDRRVFLGGAAVGMLPLVSTEKGDNKVGENRSEKAHGFPAYRAQKDPDNLEYPFASLDGFLVPNEQFYVRTHFHVPELDAKSWRLKIKGAVESRWKSTMTSCEDAVAHADGAFGVLGQWSRLSQAARRTVSAGNWRRRQCSNGPAFAWPTCWSEPASRRMLWRSFRRGGQRRDQTAQSRFPRRYLVCTQSVVERRLAGRKCCWLTK